MPGPDGHSRSEPNGAGEAVQTEQPAAKTPLVPRAQPTAALRQLAPDATLGGSPFPPIADYGFLSDCETVALVAPSGNVEWLCLPRVDSPSVFGAMLDRSAGHFRIGPAGINVPASRRYLPGTMVLETSWATGAGWIIVRDLLLIGPWHPRGRALAHPPPRPHRLRRGPRPAPNGSLRQRRGGDPARVRPGVRLRPLPGGLGVHRQRRTTRASCGAPIQASSCGSPPT